ncbi:Gfo/Idh/MocA family protein [Alicyclobacillus sp. SO9]|uniref:Gfo/Idh/MocA family protein n=1 Tax=Alicyclobacillus sp. SO9 TaxID=2665646 RepID=UPI001E472886|nr:Gfo/Idh/MocA family oxidoreductase [Alicyclobacillus sp. SO9]
MIRWGILGAARIAEGELIPAIKQASNAELVAVASRDAAKGQAYAEKNGIGKVYSSYEDLLDSPDIDAVYIPLPNHLHAKWSIEAAKRGKHVLCEKPAALTADETRAMVEAANQHSVLWMEAFMYQFHPQWQRVGEIIDSGEIGDVKLIEAHFSFKLDRPGDIRWDPAKGGGSLYDVGSYAVHVCRALAGDEVPSQIEGAAVFKEDGMVDLTASAVMKFPNGIIAHLDSSFDVAGRQEVELAGSKGSLVISHAFRPDQGDAKLRITTSDGYREESVEQENMYRLQVEHFGNAVEQGLPLRNTPEQSIRNMEIIDAIYAAAGRKE